MPLRAHYKRARQDKLALFCTVGIRPIGFVSRDQAIWSALTPPNWLCFAQSVLSDLTGRAVSAPGRTNWLCLAQSSLSSPPVTPNWLCFARQVADELALFCTPGPRLPADTLAKLGLFGATGRVRHIAGVGRAHHLPDTVNWVCFAQQPVSKLALFCTMGPQLPAKLGLFCTIRSSATSQVGPCAPFPGL